MVILTFLAIPNEFWKVAESVWRSISQLSHKMGQIWAIKKVSRYGYFWYRVKWRELYFQVSIDANEICIMSHSLTALTRWAHVKIKSITYLLLCFFKGFNICQVSLYWRFSCVPYLGNMEHIKNAIVVFVKRFFWGFIGYEKGFEYKDHHCLRVIFQYFWFLFYSIVVSWINGWTIHLALDVTTFQKSPNMYLS